jgi:hypothetical protein
MNPAFDADALYAKSQLYVKRGFRAKATGDVDEYQLWASLALELLGKSTLASKHPALIANPTHQPSIFSACGIDLLPNVMTISAKTVFERIGHLEKAFDTRRQHFCDQMSLRRNSELHSGESPFSGMNSEVWEPEFWGVMVHFLAIQDRTLDDYLGREFAQGPADMVQGAKDALIAEVANRIDRARDDFLAKYRDPAKRQAVIDDPRENFWWHYARQFSTNVDAYESRTCPACGAHAKVGGIKWNEEVVGHADYDEEGYYESVDIMFIGEEFYCTVCDLKLIGVDEILAAGLQDYFIIHDVRERTFEDEYNNE